MSSHVFVGVFALGRVVATAGVMAKVSEDERISALTRHINADWGEICDEDKVANDGALAHGDGRLMSVYRTVGGMKYWIITEHDRSVTTLLLPEEY
ncbi:hypothetical protein [Paenibacillus sp. 1P07SE]|uniref:hypothetical protein n=1 Tax=Paenibacillus sp. 1P07SE TaxID=3132209 RepID=UPI0039A6A8E3